MTVKAKKAIIWSTVGTVGTAAVVLPIVLTQVLSNFTPQTNDRELRSRTMGPIMEEIIPGSEKPRTPNNEFYVGTDERPLMSDKYKSRGFRYPAYNFQYNEWKPGTKEPKQIWEYTEGGVTKKMNLLEAIYNEEIFTYTSESFADAKPVKDTRFSSEGFVLDEIKHNRLKKHPATKGLYRDMVQDDVMSVTKRFVIPTRILGTNETGLYIPPGELAELTFSDETYKWVQEHQWIPFKVNINNNCWNGQIENPGPSQTYRPMGGRHPFMRTDFGFWDGWIKKLPDDPENKGKKIFPKTIKIGSPFGGIINIFTRNETTKKINGVEKPLNLDFKISGAVPTMHYLDGVTTQEEWNKMIQEVYDRKRAPFFTANTFFFSFGFPFWSKDNEPNKVAIFDKDLKTFGLPDKIFRKWFDFLFSSWYFSSADRGAHRKTDMQFSYNGDVWGGAAGWGGGDALYASIDWAQFAFLSDVRNWTYGGNWGVYHEINHNYEQNAAFFRQKGHGQTNEVTMAALAQLNDTLRARTEYEPLVGENDGWPALANYYGLIRSITNKWWGGEEYGLYSNILYTVGPYNFMNYVRYDVRNHSNGDSNWTGQSEAINLCNYFKMNLWDALDFYKQQDIWNKLKLDMLTPTSAEQQEINKIREQYKRVDFVGNVYAAGAYIYDNETGDFKYGGDSNPSFTIPFGEEYEFDMKTYTNSIVGVPWEGMEIPSKTANGAKLVRDTNDPYKFKYIPNYNGIKDRGLEDEFDVALIVDSKYAKENNSVPKYKWKIKVRQETNTPTIEHFEEHTKRPFIDELKLIDAYDKDPNNSELKFVKKTSYMSIQLNEFLIPKDQIKQHEMSRIKFKYIVPETRTYNIKYWCDDRIRIKANNVTTNEKFTYEQPSYIGSYRYVSDPGETKEKDFNWKKGDVIDFELVGVNTGGAGGYGIQLQKVDPVTKNKLDVDFIKDSVVSNIFEINDKYFGLKSVSDFLTDIKYAYKWRQLDTSKLPFITSKFLDVGGYGVPYSNIDDYNWYFNENGKIKPAPELKNDGLWEKWGGYSEKPLTLYLEFNNPQDIAGLVVAHRPDHHYEERPTKIKVTDLTSPSSPVILYDDVYAKEFNDRSWDKSILNFEKSASAAKQLKVELWNTRGGHGLALKNIKPFSQRFYNFKVSNSFGCDDWRILYSGRWEIKENSINDKYQSNMNNSYIQSGSWTQNQIKFNVYGNGFTIVGPLVQENPAIIDIYVNDQLVKADFSTQAKEFDPNASIYTQVTKTDKPEKFEVKIVVKSGSFIFNYLNTYGDYSNLYLNKKGH